MGGEDVTGDVLVWTTSTGDTDRALSAMEDLTGWEASDSSFHLEDVVPVVEASVDPQGPSGS